MSTVNRNGLIHAVIFFAQNSVVCEKIMLFKLLYLLDFEIFSKTGKSVTGCEYQAWKFGPVPIELMEEWEQMETDLAAAIYIEDEKGFNNIRQVVKVKHGVLFDDGNFTIRALNEMVRLAAIYGNVRSHEEIGLAQQKGGPWDVTWRDGQGAYDTIPYELAIPADAPERQDVLRIASETRMRRASLDASHKAYAH